MWRSLRTSASTSSSALSCWASAPTSTVGLSYRWIIKGVYAVGLWLVVLGILSVLFRVIVFLFGNKPSEEVNLKIGHVVTDV